MSDTTVPHVTNRRMLELIQARCDRLSFYAKRDTPPPPAVLAKAFEQLLDLGIAYCGPELARAYYGRLLMDTRVRHGLCLDCGNRPALRNAFLLCGECQSAENTYERDVEATRAQERAQAVVRP